MKDDFSDWDVQQRFEQHAHPGAIAAVLDSYLRQRRLANRRIDWLTELLGRRKAEMEAGVWPRQQADSGKP